MQNIYIALITANVGLFALFCSLAIQRENYLRDKQIASDLYKKALDTQVRTIIINISCDISKTLWFLIVCVGFTVLEYTLFI